MLTVYDSQENSYVLTERIGSGGEGTVYSLPETGETVAKIYHAPVSDAKAEKLRWMAANQNEQLLKVAAWITDVLCDAPGGKTVGFLMPSVKAKEIHELYSLKSRRIYFPRANWQFLIHAATNVARAFYGLHKNEHIMGDVNHGNCVVLANGTVKLIDCDSYSISDGARRYPCEVGVATHLAPELQGKNLAAVERSAAHDNFGLAVIIFQLLFLGRHPFAGNFAGGEDKTLEECIREFRFAYARDAHLWNVKRPPGTLALDAVSPRVGLLFERAFLTEDRPEPREWIEALEDLSNSLKQCGLHPGHHYFNQLAACPFCEIEANTGLMLFPFIGENTDGEENFNIFTIENLIANLGVPQNLPAKLAKPKLEAVPSSNVLAERKIYRQRIVMLAFLQFLIVVFLVGMFSIMTAFFFGILLMSVFLANIIQSQRNLKEELQNKLLIAQTDWEELEFQWTKSNAAADFNRKISAIKEKIAEYQKIQQQNRWKTKILREESLRRQLDVYLSAYQIAEAKISDIDEKTLSLLRISGIRSAADVKGKRLHSLTAINSEVSGNLLEWRKNLEKNFVPDAAADLPAVEQKQLTVEFVEKRRKIEKEIEQSLGTLRSGALALRQTQQKVVAKVETAARQLTQAEIDFRTIGSGAAATVTLLAVTFSTLIIGAVNDYSPSPPPPTTIRKSTVSEPPRPEFESEKSFNKKSLYEGSDYETDHYVYDNITDDKIAEMSDVQRRMAAKTLYRQSLGSLDEGDYNRAEKKLRLAVRLHDRDIMILDQFSEVLYERKKYSESLDAALKASALDPRDIYAKILIGKNYLKLSEFEKARKIFTGVTDGMPTSFEGYFNLGLAEKGLNNYGVAFDAFAKAGRLNPEAAAAYYEMAICLNKLGDADAARQQYLNLRKKDIEMAKKLKREIGIK